MTRFLLASAAIFGLAAGVASAQPSGTIVATPGTTAPAPPVPPPPGVLSTTVTKKSVGPDGSLGYSESTTYGKGPGVVNSTTTATYPPPAAITTQQTTTTTTTQP